MRNESHGENCWHHHAPTIRGARRQSTSVNTTAYTITSSNRYGAAHFQYAAFCVLSLTTMTMSPQYADPAAAAVPDPYSDYSAPPAAPPRDDRDRDRDAPPSRRSRSRSPARSYARSVRSPVPPKRPSHAPIVRP